MPRGHLRHQITVAALPASCQDLAPPISLFRNGSELRKTLPLWKVPETYTASTGVLSRIHRFPLFRNGSELRKTLPLWAQPCDEGVEAAGQDFQRLPWAESGMEAI